MNKLLRIPLQNSCLSNKCDAATGVETAISIFMVRRYLAIKINRLASNAARGAVSMNISANMQVCLVAESQRCVIIRERTKARNARDEKQQNVFNGKDGQRRANDGMNNAA